MSLTHTNDTTHACGILSLIITLRSSIRVERIKRRLSIQLPVLAHRRRRRLSISAFKVGLGDPAGIINGPNIRLERLALPIRQFFIIKAALC